MYDDLKNHLKARIRDCRGEWVKKSAHYEPSLCSALGIDHNDTRYQDATWNNYSIELKKGTSIWLDLVRYSEIIIEKPNLNSQASICLFCIPNKDKDSIVSVIAVSTPKLLDKLAISDRQAVALLELRDNVSRQLNAQASLTVSDVRSIANFSVGLLDDFL